MQAIEVDDDVYGHLKSLAEPFVDTPNSVLRRLLGLDTGASGPAPTTIESNGATKKKAAMSRRPKPKAGAKERSRVPAGSILPEDQYEVPLLEALVEAGGQGASKEITEAVGSKLKDRLTELDLEPLKSGGIRWENRIQFVRLRMIERGLMVKEAPRGVWAISDAGREFVASAS